MSVGGVYIAYPIDQRGGFASLAHLFDQIEAFKTTLIGKGLAKWVFDPGDAFLVNADAEVDDTLPRINRAALSNADVVVAFLPAGIPTVGVPMEIDRAHSMGKHVWVFTDAKQSWMLNLPRLWRASNWEDEAIAGCIEWVANLEPPVQTRQHEVLPVKVDVEGCMPRRTYEDDAGLDLVVSEEVVIEPGTFSDVPCGVSVSLPDHTWGLITGRSSALRKRGLLIHSGVIDAGYRGPLFAGAWNMTAKPVIVSKGERIAQFIVLNNATRYLTPARTDQLSNSMRGTNGFGSTGT